jgi:hypothetical protein
VCSSDLAWTATPRLSKIYAGNAQGQGAVGFESAAGLTNVMSVFSSSAQDFAQFAIVNTSNGADASTDFIAYSANGNNDAGWIDMGITSDDFDAETYGITGPNDGYIFMSAPRTNILEVTQVGVAGDQATIRTGVAHPYVTGQKVKLIGVGEEFDGLQTITATPTATTFRFTTSAPPQSTVNLDPFGSVYRPLGDGNLVLATDATGLENKIVFAAGGFDSGRTQMEITPDVNVHIEIETESTSPTTGAFTVVGGTGVQGNLYVSDIVNAGEKLYVGENAEQFEEDAELTNAAAVIRFDNGETEDGFAQVAFKNADPTSSSDIIAYMDNGNDSNGWVGIGITGSQFNDENFGITGPGDGYIFHETLNDDYNGNLVFATGAAGAENKIIFAAGGFDSGLTQMEITPDETVKIAIDTPSTSPITGALTVVGGVGIQGDVFIQGSITFGGTGTEVTTENLTVSEPIIFIGNGNPGDSLDLGVIGEYKVGEDKKYAGLVRDASDGVVKFFTGASTKASSGVVDFSESGLEYANLRAQTLSVEANPTQALQVTPKQYVDSFVSDAEIALVMLG